MFEWVSSSLYSAFILVASICDLNQFVFRGVNYLGVVLLAGDSRVGLFTFVGV